jgi:pyruvate/2-oxoglutarate dehydrogenase complex dihydrolipoamide acyltransferase (E2) component
VNRLTLAVGMVIATLVGQAAAAPAPSENATINLIRLLVEQGVLKQDKADALIAQARTKRQAKQAAPPPSPRAGRRRAMCACSTCRPRCATRSAIRSRPR